MSADHPKLAEGEAVMKIKITDEMYRGYLAALYNSGWGNGIKAIASLIAAQVLEQAAQVADAHVIDAYNEADAERANHRSSCIAAAIRALKIEVE